MSYKVTRHSFTLPELIASIFVIGVIVLVGGLLYTAIHFALKFW